ncbi:MAG: Flp pilus assembly protein CpaB [Candidatus Dormibacteraceae bacterium]
MLGNPAKTNPKANPRAGRLKLGGRPLTLVGAALAILALLLFVTLGRNGQGAGGAPAAAGVPVVVAAKDLPIRTTISAADLTIGHLVPADVPPGAFTRVSQLKSLTTAVVVPKGMPLTANLVVSSADAVSAPAAAYLPIPHGFVAMAVPTGEQQGVAGFIQAGDYVSIIDTYKGAVRTVFTNLHVLRVGPANTGPPPSASPAPGGTSSGASYAGVSSSLTVVITQCQAEFLRWFLQNSQVAYTLESYHDYQPQNSVDPTCPTVSSARGVTAADVAAHWPGLITGG